MSGRQQKKMRKLVAAGARQIQTQMESEIDNRVQTLIKPKPKWLPAWLYRKIVTLVINRIS